MNATDINHVQKVLRIATVTQPLSTTACGLRVLRQPLNQWGRCRAGYILDLVKLLLQFADYRAEVFDPERNGTSIEALREMLVNNELDMITMYNTISSKRWKIYHFTPPFVWYKQSFLMHRRLKSEQNVNMSMYMALLLTATMAWMHFARRFFSARVMPGFLFMAAILVSTCRPLMKFIQLATIIYRYVPMYPLLTDIARAFSEGHFYAFASLPSCAKRLNGTLEARYMISLPVSALNVAKTVNELNTVIASDPASATCSPSFEHAPLLRKYESLIPHNPSEDIQVESYGGFMTSPKIANDTLVAYVLSTAQQYGIIDTVFKRYGYQSNAAVGVDSEHLEPEALNLEAFLESLYTYRYTLLAAPAFFAVELLLRNELDFRNIQVMR